MKPINGVLSRLHASAALVLALLGIAGCGSVQVRHAGPALPPLPPLVTTGAVQYSIRSDLSDVVFLVYRAGPLAAFGHDHVIRARDIHGHVYLNRDFTLSGFDLSVPLAMLQVDVRADRAKEGPDFTEQPSAAAVAGTRHNMLGPEVLDAARYPELRVRSVRITGLQTAPQVTVRITLHGVERDLRVPLALEISGKLLVARGRFEIRQSDFGIAPFSILGGGLRVADTVKVQFHIIAVRD